MLKGAQFRAACVLIHFFVLIAFLSAPSAAAPVGKEQAQKAVRGWLRENRNPMDCPISNRPAEADILTDDDGQTLCYIVNLEPEGFVIISADDVIEPVIAFSSTGYYDGAANSPLTTMLRKDMPRRLTTAHQHGRDQIRSQKKLHEWQSLLNADKEAAAEPLEMSAAAAASVSEVWVDPFLPSAWNQGDVLGSPCYNYYTPNHYPTGCVATAMAQVIRYYAYPTVGIGVHAFTIEVNGVPQTAYTRGGNGSGGAYNWAQMPYDPSSAVTTTQRQAIGALCCDAGVTVEMSYASGGSSASLFDADQQLTGTFDYANCIYTQSFSSSGDARLWNILNANLDAQMPVILGISRVGGGHAVIADGYGYNGQTLYHHINMGWGGADNAWYQLPLIDASMTYTVIDDCAYNIDPVGSGEIISGRVTNLAGVPLQGVTVRAYYGSSLHAQTVTDSRGVYALTHLSSNTTYRISAQQTGEIFLDQSVKTGTSSDWGTPGNRSGIFFESGAFGPPTVFDVEADTDSTDSVTIQLQALDDGQPDPNLMQLIITSLPLHGDLSEPNVGPIDTVPYVMAAADANGVTYTPCPYFGGQDTFTYKANDGGTYPTGGDSNTATVTVNVNNALYTNFGVDSHTYSTLLMNTEMYYDVRAQAIMLQSDLGSRRRLTDIAFDVYAVPGRTLSNWTIRMQHTDWTSYPSTYDVTDMFLTSGWTTVYQANETITQTGWHTFHFDVPFEYNGSQNLLIDFSFNNSGKTSPPGAYHIATATESNRMLALASTTGTQGDPLQWDFWALGGSYFTGSVPSMKFTGVPAIDPLVGDFDASCNVKLPDLAIFSQAWQTSSGDAAYQPECDLTASKGTIDLQDLIIFAGQWLQTYQ